MIKQEVAVTIKRNSDTALTVRSLHSLEELDQIIANSEPLVPGATRAVLGEGPVRAPIAFVGEQPGDQEDLLGRPFVGPAGQLLNGAFEQGDRPAPSLPDQRRKTFQIRTAR